MELIVPIAGTVVSVPGTDAEPVRAGTAIVVLEAMKMEHEIVAEQDGVVQSVTVAVGESVQERQTLVVLAPGLSASGAAPARGSGRRPPRGTTSSRCANAAIRVLTMLARKPSRGATPRGGAPRGRTWTTSSTKDRWSSMARWCSPPRSAVAPSRS